MIRLRLLSRRFAFAALCIALAGVFSASAADTTPAEIGYMPILPDAQLFVGLEDGAIEAAGIDADLVSFQNGPAMVQALLAGQLDIAYLGIGPAMVARGKGADIKVVASNITQQISFVALGKLADAFDDGDAAGAFSRFKAATGRVARVSTFPVGSVPQTVLQHWLQREIQADADDIDIIYQGASQVQQSLLTGAVDGAAILEPVISITQDRNPDARVVASGSQMFDSHPGAVIAVREAFIQAHPDIVTRLVAAHVEATRALQAGEEDAVDAVHQYVGGGRLARTLVARAIERSAENFEADPHAIIDGTRRLQAFQKELGTLKADTDIDALIDTRFYDRAVNQSDNQGNNAAGNASASNAGADATTR